MTLQISPASGERSALALLPSILRQHAAASRPSRVYSVRRTGSHTEIGTFVAEAAFSAAAALHNRGLGRGDRVVIAMSGQVETLVAYLGAVAIGAVPLIGQIRTSFQDKGNALSRIRELLTLTGDGSWLLASENFARSAPADIRLAVIEAEPQPDPNSSWLLPQVEEHDIAHLQLTSGSSGEPRLVAVSHGSLAANLRAISGALGVGPDDVFVSWLPLYHDLGLVGTCLAAVHAGADLHLLSPFDYLRDPLLWLRTISEVRATVTCAPDFALRHVAQRASAAETSALDLRSLRRLVCGGEPVNAGSIRRLARALETTGFDWRSVAPSYGLAEATVYVSTRAHADGALRAVVRKSDLLPGRRVTILDSGPVVGSDAPIDPGEVELVAVGGVRGVDFWVADEHGTPTEEGRCGEIIVGGSSVALGYQDASGRLEPFDSRNLPTGDIGFIIDGDLFVVDRVKNIVIRHGEKMPTYPVEQTIARVCGIDVGAIAVLELDPQEPDGSIVAFIETDADHALACAEAIAEVNRHLPFRLDEVVAIPPRSLPRTTSGKKQPHRARYMFQRAQFHYAVRIPVVEPRAVAGCPPSIAEQPVIDLDLENRAQQLIELVRAVAREHGCDRPVSLQSHLLADLEIDSLGRFELAVRVEESFGVGLADEDLDGLESVRQLLDLVESSRQQPGIRLGELMVEFSEQAEGVQIDVDEQRLRQLRVGDRWVTDLASVNYLGFDVEESVARSICPLVDQWGTHPSWTRAVASPLPYRQLEGQLARLIGADDTVIFPTITLLHFGVMPRLAGRDGVLLIESTSHHSMHEAAELASARGTQVVTWPHGDLDSLERALKQYRSKAMRVIGTVGVNSMSGDILDVPRLCALAAANDAIIYVDDAHGLGLLGEDPDEHCTYGYGGGGVIRYHGVESERIIYVAGLSKAFSAMGAFVSCNDRYRRQFFMNASTMVFSGPVPTASLATALAALELNKERGDAARMRVHDLTARLLAGLSHIGVPVHAHSGLPIVNIEFGPPRAVQSALREVWRQGFLVTPALFPAAPLQRGGLRVSPTAANTETEIDRFVDAIERARAITCQERVPS